MFPLDSMRILGDEISATKKKKPIKNEPKQSFYKISKISETKIKHLF